MTEAYFKETLYELDVSELAEVYDVDFTDRLKPETLALICSHWYRRSINEDNDDYEEDSDDEYIPSDLLSVIAPFLRVKRVIRSMDKWGLIYRTWGETRVRRPGDWTAMSRRIMKDIGKSEKGSLEWNQQGMSVDMQIMVNPMNYRLFHFYYHCDESNEYWPGLYLIIDVFLTEGYPMKPPKCKVRNALSLFHPRVDVYGRMCLDKLRDGWTPALTVPKIARYIAMNIILECNMDDFKELSFRRCEERMTEEEWARIRHANVKEQRQYYFNLDLEVFEESEY